MRRLAWLVLLALPLVAAADAELDRLFERDVLVIAARKPVCYRFDIYVAATNAQRQRGLMFVRELPLSTGMLFVYERDGRLSMWMRNTYIPLDMLFVRADGTIASIAQHTEPLSLQSIVASEPVRYVLELNAGAATRFDIDTNSRLLLPESFARDE